MTIFYIARNVRVGACVRHSSFDGLQFTNYDFRIFLEEMFVNLTTLFQIQNYVPLTRITVCRTAVVQFDRRRLNYITLSTHKLPFQM